MDDTRAAEILKSPASGTSPDGGTTVDVLAATHERTRAGTEARLVKHERLDAEQAGAARIR